MQLGEFCLFTQFRMPSEREEDRVGVLKISRQWDMNKKAA